jgi:hypothetical protein
MRNELGNGAVVADDDALEAPLPAHQVAQDRDMGGERNIVHVGEGGHDAGNTGDDRGPEGR